MTKQESRGAKSMALIADVMVRALLDSYDHQRKEVLKRTGDA